MLISCPECLCNVSERAISCPSCGYPLISYKASRRPYKKRMRLPNGFGRITEIKGKNLRNPFRAMVSVGKDETGKPIGVLLKPESYFATYNEAYTALIKYHENPYDFSNDLTFAELYDRWFEVHTKGLSKSRIDAIKTIWSYCDSISTKPVQTVRTRDIKELLDTATRTDNHGNIIQATPITKKNIKYVISSMLDYAVEYEIVSRNYAKDITSTIKTDEPTHHITFSDDEMAAIESAAKKHANIIPRLVLIQCYMGWRPNELLSLKTNQVNMKDWYIIGGSKTAAGKNRMVPIHTKIRNIIQEAYSDAIKNGRQNLFTKKNGDAFTYSVYSYEFKKMLEDLLMNPDHKPHDCRKQFITMAKKSGVDEYAIKLMVGHTIKDLTESTYTERDINWLHKELKKIM